MSQKIPYEVIMDRINSNMQRIKFDVDYVAEEAYQKGLDDAWSFARHLNAVSSDITDNIYLSANGCKGLDVALEMTYEDAKKEYEEYFQRKQEEKIRVGDEICDKNGDCKAVVMDEGNDSDFIVVLTENGCVEEWERSEASKSGKHHDEVAELIEKLREEE